MPESRNDERSSTHKSIPCIICMNYGSNWLPRCSSLIPEIESLEPCPGAGRIQTAVFQPPFKIPHQTVDGLAMLWRALSTKNFNSRLNVALTWGQCWRELNNCPKENPRRIHRFSMTQQSSSSVGIWACLRPRTWRCTTTSTRRSCCSSWSLITSWVESEDSITTHSWLRFRFNSREYDAKLPDRVYIIPETPWNPLFVVDVCILGTRMAYWNQYS